SAFAAIVAGGLWLALWRGRRRLAGLVAVAAGLALAPTLPQPDLIVGRDGRLVAVRLDNGKLSAIGARGARFELSRWLEHDGDGREAESAAQADGFRCDETGCTARSRGLLIAVTRHASALATDCARAAIVVSQVTATVGCTGPRLVIERRAVAAAGSHVVRAGPRRIEVATVAAARGVRPWTTPPVSRLRQLPRRDGWRLDRFTSPVELAVPRPQQETETRPEVEGW
ncbi:MAG: hypothetical protein AB7O57_19670, partial [Hyphomicrobiaceae bacterium]